MEPVNGFTVAMLGYGQHPELVTRCLDSLISAMDPSYVLSLRVGLNAACPLTRAAAYRLASAAVCREVLVYDNPENGLKYPMMRRMLYDETHPVVTPWFVWFDDDSCLAPGTTSAWWERLFAAVTKPPSADVLGAVYAAPLRGRQAWHIARQPWYTGQPLPAGHRFTFATGGFWVARTRFLHRWGYPFGPLTHNGGDTLLGELVRQQGGKLRAFREQVWVNADEQGRESKAERRGTSRPPLWSTDDNPEAPNLRICGKDPR